MARNLNSLKDVLYTAFYEAAEKGSDWRVNEANRPVFLTAAAEIAQSIVAIEREQREAAEVKIGQLPGKRAS